MTLAWYFLKPLILTIAVEAAVGLCLRFDRPAQAALLRCNIITNPSLSLILLIAASFGAAGFIYYAIVAVLEVAVVMSESYLLRYQLGNERKWTLISLAVNGASFLFGILLSQLNL